VIINNTDQRLLIYYDKKIPVAGQTLSNDNSVILLSNVRIKRLVFYLNYNI